MPGLILVLDENVRGSVAIQLRQSGVYCWTLQERGRAGLTDPVQVARALESGFVIVTHDDDYVALDRAGTAHAGMLYCAQRKYKSGGLIAALQRAYEQETPDSLRGQVRYT